MNHRASPRFWSCYHLLPQEIRRLADRSYETLVVASLHSLHAMCAMHAMQVFRGGVQRVQRAMKCRPTHRRFAARDIKSRACVQLARLVIGPWHTHFGALLIFVGANALERWS